MSKMENKKIRQNMTGLFEVTLKTGTVGQQVFKYQASIYAKSEAEAMRKRWEHVLNQLQADHRAHERRVDDFTYQGRIMYVCTLLSFK